MVVVAHFLESSDCDISPVEHEQHSVSCLKAYRSYFISLDILYLVIFTVEYVLKIWACAKDICLLITVLRLIWGTELNEYEFVGIFSALRMLRAFRSFMISEDSDEFKLIKHTLRNSRMELLMISYMLTLTIAILSTVVYHCEKNQPDTVFTSAMASSWFILITMTTVGYGDMVPKSASGKFFSGISAIIGSFVMNLFVQTIFWNACKVFSLYCRINEERKAEKKTGNAPQDRAATST
ncbi:potassium voltage-gated channel subfamily D member 2-like isoform X2 [Paramacrobiotus metropolitanus]|uniref:potassium voltage-gated channel subfamily D member 2-like isoform X2 n=1 Tax=Paramacrobiotus metropolitanus TaxID=2943436 RepID=UPI002445BE27|nr:potassium voltage-gated channel subfamily D member 2-like isoform X2 [Paramacrobiotus metropolitanus]